MRSMMRQMADASGERTNPIITCNVAHIVVLVPISLPLAAAANLSR